MLRHILRTSRQQVCIGGWLILEMNSKTIFLVKVKYHGNTFTYKFLKLYLYLSKLLYYWTSRCLYIFTVFITNHEPNIHCFFHPPLIVTNDIFCGKLQVIPPMSLENIFDTSFIYVEGVGGFISSFPDVSCVCVYVCVCVYICFLCVCLRARACVCVIFNHSIAIPSIAILLSTE